MTSTEIAVIDAEVVDGVNPTEIEPLSEGKAKVLDKRIRLAGIRVADEGAKLLDLLEEAALGQIHVALGYASWGAYVKEAVQISPANVEERQALVSMMSGKGLSQRAMAGILGVDQATISRDQSLVDADASPVVEGLDGKTYTKPKKEPKPDVIDVDVVEEEVKVQPVSVDFKDEMGYLGNSVLAFQDILKDERFPKARKTIAKGNLNKLQDAISELQLVVDALMEP